MNCSKALSLLPLHLDGDLSNDVEALLAEHAAGCASCARELSLQEMLSTTLQEIGQDEVQAPPELCSLVMGKLRQERKIAVNWLPAAWRKSMAAAAAILLIAGGSAGVTAGLKMAGGGKMVGFETQANIDANTGGSAALNTDVPSIQPDPLQPGVSIPGNVQVSSIPAGNAAGNIDTPVVSGTGTSLPAAPLSLDKALVLLNSSMIINSSVLKVAVGNLPEARVKAESIAAGAGVETQAFSEFGGGKEIVVIRLTAPSDLARSLISEFNGLGTLIEEPQNESRDITNLYNDTVLQYRELLSELSSAKDTAEKQQLEAQAYSYKRQLEAWEDEAGRQVIMLWLESR